MRDVKRTFIDTNVLLALMIEFAPRHAQAVALLTNAVGDGAELWINRQIIREYLSQVTRPQAFLEAQSLRQVVEQIAVIKAKFNVADETAAVTERLLDLIQTYPTGGKQIHDANIVATMLVHEIDTLLTFNVDDMKRFSPNIKLVSSLADFPHTPSAK